MVDLSLPIATERLVLRAFPIPAPEGTPPWLNVIFGCAALTVFVVIVWQAVRYFRDHRDD